MVKALIEHGARVVAYDPSPFRGEARTGPGPGLGRLEDSRVLYADSPMQAVQDADALIVMTEWKAFKSPNFAALKSVSNRHLRRPPLRSGDSQSGLRILRDRALTGVFDPFAAQPGRVSACVESDAHRR
jgi:hypothetical protein